MLWYLFMFPEMQTLCKCWMLLEAAQPTKQTPNPAPANVYKKSPKLWMTPSTQSSIPCQEKGNFGDGIPSIFFICVRSWAAVFLPDWSGAKNLVRQPKKKHFRGTNLKDPKVCITFFNRHVLILLLHYQLAMFCSSSGKDDCFFCLHCLLRTSKMPHIVELWSLFIYLLMASKRFLALSSPKLGRKVK